MEELATILEHVGYIKYAESEMLFKAMDKKYMVKCPDWILDRCLNYV